MRKLYVLLVLVFVASVAEAGPITGCINLADLPDSWTIVSDHHTQVGAWEMDASQGCTPTGPGGVPTGGMYSRSFGEGLFNVTTVYKSGFNPCKSTQLDHRGVDAFGNLFDFQDVIVVGPGGCAPVAPVTPPDLSYNPSPSEGGWVPPAGPPAGPPPTVGPPTVPSTPEPPPVSVPDGGATALLFVVGLVGIWGGTRCA